MGEIVDCVRASIVVALLHHCNKYTYSRLAFKSLGIYRLLSLGSRTTSSHQHKVKKSSKYKLRYNIMGKNKSNKGGGGNKKGGSEKVATKQQQCTCDHPYQCNCGNRPERPSR